MSTTHPSSNRGEFGHRPSGAYGFLPKRSAGRRLVARVLAVGAMTVGSVVVFALSATVAVLVHLGTPRARRLAATEVNAILAPSFKGRIRIERIGGLGLFGLSGTNVTIDDPGGRPVLVAQGIRVRIATWGMVRSALFATHGPLTIDLTNVSVDTLDVRLDTDADGNLDLANAFAPSKPSAPADPNARGMRLDISHVALTHGWAHGEMAGAPPIDVTLDGLRGALTYAPDGLEGDVSDARVSAHKIVSGSDVVGSLAAHVKKPSDAKVNPDARLTWHGTVGGIAESIGGSFVNNRLDAFVDAPTIAPADVRTLWPDSPIDQPANAHVEAHGALPDIEFDLHAGLGPARIDAKGNASIADNTTLKVSLDAHDVDAHEFAASAPPSQLGLRGDVSAEMSAEGAVKGIAGLKFLGGRVGANPVPSASIHATASRSKTKELRADADVLVDEPGAPTRFTAHIAPKGDSSTVDFALTSQVADFDSVPRLNHAVKGSANLDVRGGLDVASMSLEAHVHARASDVNAGANRVTTAWLEAHARGAAAAPQLDVALHSRGIDAGGVHLVSADVDASGLATRPHVTIATRGPDTPDLDATGDVALVSGVSLSDLRVRLARGADEALIAIGQVVAGGGRVRVDDARIEGLGEPTTATLVLSPGGLRLRAATGGIDLGRVGRIAHVEKSLKAGTLAFDTDLDLKRDGGDGRAKLDLTRGAAGGVQDIAMSMDLTLAGRKFAGKAHVAGAGVGTIDLDAQSLELGGGGPLSPTSWREAWGHINFDVHADLAKVAALLPPDAVPLSETRGDVVVKGHFGRDDLKDMTPDVALSVNTNGLALAAKTPAARDIDGVFVYPPPAWRLKGVDFVLDAQIDGDKGNVQVSTHAHDAKGELAQLDVKLPKFPFDDVFHHAGSLNADLRTTPFDVKIAIPERALGSLPDVIKQTYVSGRLKADLTATGTMVDPKVDLAATLRKGSSAGGSLKTPLDVDITAKYDGRLGQVSAKALALDQEVLSGEIQLDAVARAFLDAANPAPAWKASARLHFAGFPMESIAVLDDKLVSGKINGDLSLADLHENGRADAQLSIDALHVGSIAYKSARVQAKADGKTIDALIRIDQADGFAETKAHAIAAWGATLAPVLDRTQPLAVSLSSKNFRVAVFMPFVESTLDELDGRLDADTRLELDPTTRGAHLSGGLALSRGSIEAVAGGGEIHDLAAAVKFSPDGTINLEKISGAGLTGRFEGNGSAHLEGTTLKSAKAAISIPKDSPIPLSIGGSELGNIDGRVEVTEAAAAGAGAGMEVKVSVPNLRVAVPEGSTATAQALGMPDNVRIGAHRGQPTKFVLVPLDPVKKEDSDGSESPAASSSALVIDTNLGDVEVVRGQQLRIDLNGHVNVKSGKKSVVTGQIHLQPGGVLDVRGKGFTVESGTITFVGDDPSNPEIVVKAGWTSPDGTTVYANFVGPLKTGKVTLTSEPQLPQQEIVQLLMFGTADGQQAQTQSADTNTQVGAAAGGEAAQPLNHALGQLGLGAVSAKVDTTESSNPKPEVEVQIARDISIQLAVVLGQPLPGVNPDHALVSLDWRFAKKWTFSSTLGDQGTTIFDLLWQKRY